MIADAEFKMKKQKISRSRTLVHQYLNLDFLACSAVISF